MKWRHYVVENHKPYLIDYYRDSNMAGLISQLQAFVSRECFVGEHDTTGGCYFPDPRFNGTNHWEKVRCVRGGRKIHARRAIEYAEKMLR